MYKLIFLLILYVFITPFTIFDGYSQIFITKMPDCSKVIFDEDNITIGFCNLNVYKAVTNEQKICGMLNFTDDTFHKDGMIFIDSDDSLKKHYFHTEGMKMDIRIIGIIKNINNSYTIYNNDVKYSPPGIKSITIYGNSVFETSEKKYQDNLNKCLLGIK